MRIYCALAFILGAVALAALEPMPVRLDIRPTDPDLSVPPGFEARVSVAFEDAVASLPRYDTTDDDALIEGYLEFAIVDFWEERVWVPDETEPDDSDDEPTGLFGFLFGWIGGASIEEEESGRWMWDVSVTVRGRLRPIDRPRGGTAFTETAGGLAERRSEARDNAVFEISSLLEPELRRMFILRGQSAVLDRRTVEIDLGDEIGVETGDLYRIRDGRGIGAVTLVRIVDTEWERSVARIVRQARTRDASGPARELVDNPADVRIQVVTDLPSQSVRPGDGNQGIGIGAALHFVLSPYSALYGGGGVRFFGVDDSRGRRNGGMCIEAFGGYHLLHAPRIRYAGVAAVAPAMEASFVVARRTDLVFGAGYRFSTETREWWVIVGSRDARFFVCL
jgi:hypothetical protein